MFAVSEAVPRLSRRSHLGARFVAGEGLAVMLSWHGLSWGRFHFVGGAGGVCEQESCVGGVQAVAQPVAGLRQRQVLEAVRNPALGGDVTSVKCNGRGLPLGLTVDDVTGLVLSGEEARRTQTGGSDCQASRCGTLGHRWIQDRG